MDKTIINLITILIAGYGLFEAFTHFDAPELRMTFWGENPYQVKKAVMDRVMKWLFVFVTLIGFAMQAVKEIFYIHIMDRIYPTTYYVVLFLVGLVCLYPLNLIVVKCGGRIARKRWMPLIIDSQREAFIASKYVVEHGGWREDQMVIKDKEADPQKYISANMEQVESRITQIEKLLELDRGHGEFKDRISKLEKYF